MSKDITNLRDTIIAKSDQLNADDITGGTMTITVTSVKRGDSDQPVVIHYEGDNGRPYKPCKTMRRVLIAGWTENGDAWVGRSMTLYNEPSVKFGGVAVGGIRISHMTDIGNGLRLTPNASKGKKQEVIIQPLKMSKARQTDDSGLTACLDAIARTGNLAELREAAAGFAAHNLSDDQKAKVNAAYAERKRVLTPEPEVIVGEPADDDLARFDAELNEQP